MADPAFTDPRLAELYDVLEGERPDLNAYASIVEELGAHSILDVGCGTGTFACRLAREGRDVVGLDPAAASLAVARRKPGADRVRWIEGDVSALPALQLDMVTMTGNVAQVFLPDAEWNLVLGAVRSALRPGGTLVFETRIPDRRAWRAWNRDATFRRISVPGTGPVETWIDLVEVALPLVSFRCTYVFGDDGEVRTSASTLRFRERDEIGRSLQAAGFGVAEVRDAPDRPGLEMVYLARRPPETALQ